MILGPTSYPDRLHRTEGQALDIKDREQCSSTAADQLTIRISAGHGQGRTTLSAFDAALRSAGVADFNLIRLSSVIPPDSVVVEAGPDQQLRGGFGEALYCVYAAGWATAPGSEIWAGVGWSRRRDDSGAGLFVEHCGTSEQEVRDKLRTSLDDLSEGRSADFDYEGEVLDHVRCTSLPTCAVVVATYRSVGWSVS